MSVSQVKVKYTAISKIALFILFQHHNNNKKNKKKAIFYAGITLTLIAIDLVLVPFFSKSSWVVHRYGHFSSVCEFHFSISFQRVKEEHWRKVSEYIFEMLALMGMLLVSFCSSAISLSFSLVVSVILALFSDWEDLFYTQANITASKYVHTVLITYWKWEWNFEVHPLNLQKTSGKGFLFKQFGKRFTTKTTFFL